MECKEKTKEGKPCGSPERFVDPETGLCPAHSPGASARLSMAGRLGGSVAAAKRRGQGLDPDELPALDSHAAAMQWLEIIGRAVVSGRLSDKDANAAVKALEAWMRAEAGRAQDEEVAELRERLEELRKGGLKVLA
jgi:hypothetical protein